MIPLDISKINQDQEFSHSDHSIIYPFHDEKSIVKKISLKSFSEFSSALQSVILGFNLDHPSIVPVTNYSIQQTESSEYILYIQMNKIKLNLVTYQENLQKNGKSIVRESLISYIYDLVCGLEYLHNKGISHGNIKPTNILLTNKGKPVLVDVGSRNLFLEGNNKNSHLYQAPESLENVTPLLLAKRDIWSLGVVISELVLQTKGLFEKGDKEEIVKEIVKKLSEKFDENVVSIIEGMLMIDPENRSSAKEIKYILEQKFSNILEVKEVDMNGIEENKFENDLKEAMELRVHNLLRLIPNDQDPEAVKTVLDQITGEVRERFESLARVAQADFRLSESTADLQKRLEFDIPQEWKDSLQNDSVDLMKMLNKDNNNILPQVEELTEDQRIVRNWDLFRDSFEREWGPHYKLQLEEALFVRANGFEYLDDMILHNFLNDLGLNMTKYKFQLKLLELTLPAENLTANGIKALGVFLNQAQDFHSLQYLSLSFAKSPFATKLEIDGIAVRDLVSNICRSLRGLKSLSLCFSDNKKIDEGSIEDIGRSIGYNLFELKRLKLDFSWCDFVTDKAIKGMFSHLRNLKGLQKLILDFRSCKNFGDQVLEDFVNNLCRSLAHLQQIKLYLFANERITDSGVKALGTGMANCLKALQEVTLHFTKCRNISEDARNVVRQKLNYVLNLNVA